MNNRDAHHDWLSLIEISGPFLAVPVLKEAFPQGLEELDGGKRKRLRQAYDEWREAQEADHHHHAEEKHDRFMIDGLGRLARRQDATAEHRGGSHQGNFRAVDTNTGNLAESQR